jgi:hypothetical protein
MPIKFPEFFCEKGAVLRLKKDMELVTEETEKTGKTIHVPKGVLFRVHNIVGYGFDLVSLDANKQEVRVINSDMSEFFDKEL